MDTKEEVVEKIKKYIADAYQGNAKAAWDYYDFDGNGKLNLSEIASFLRDCQVGSDWTRMFYGQKIIAALDRDHDKQISWEEFQLAIHTKPPREV